MMDTKEAIVVGPRMIKGRVHCANCGKYVNGEVSVSSKKDDRFVFVCNVQCGMDFITKGNLVKN